MPCALAISPCHSQASHQFLFLYTSLAPRVSFALSEMAFLKEFDSLYDGVYVSIQYLKLIEMTSIGLFHDFYGIFWQMSYIPFAGMGYVNKAIGSGLAPWPARLTSPPPRLADFGYSNEMCEAFSTYPRTYDLRHAWTILSGVAKKDCSPEDLLIETDRIVRPTSFIIFRDNQPMIDFVKKYLTALHWEAVATADSSSDSAVQDGDEIVFIIQKKLWRTTESFSDAE
ncbi:hypothetical protein TSUD_30730 [Trifolium subterraneum]|uniref:Methyltransferase n=1 Tax=Trifolium subterraneum TaxID=3900 RepID=A0A2Z6M3V8_TRISU|nr:hypothetical protein TSUD_30730 [Trifolium subterraneum]